jgi:hypothetical protein
MTPCDEPALTAALQPDFPVAKTISNSCGEGTQSAREQSL